MATSQHDADVLRGLGRQVHEIAQLPVHKEKAELWRRMNDKDPVRPMVWITEIPWHEISDDELTPRCRDAWLREVETELRRGIYKWRHTPVDIIVEDNVVCTKCWSSTGIGIKRKGDFQRQEPGGIVACHFDAQICGSEDIEKIRMPKVTYDATETSRRLSILEEIFDGVIPVRLSGLRHVWFTPWDTLIQLVSIENIMTDLVDRPEFVNAMVDRFVDAKMHELDQIVELGLLSGELGAWRVGSGAFAYTSSLPPDDFDAEHVRTRDMWGCGNAQMFAAVSPDMHWEFSLRHELRWLERWGLTYYGCCEPLHRKVHYLKRIANLRKISMSPQADVRHARENGADDYVLSIKPNPAIFAGDTWRPEQARGEIRARLDEAQGCAVEVVMKDISTIRHDPQRLWDWARIAMEEAQRSA